tara:strand:- start:1173 stop:1511 length:339 start_codon:yes stop_codon:yes gene_type:complete
MAQGIVHIPDDDNSKLVRSLSTVGTKYEDIAIKLNISSDTLVKYYKKELDGGRIDANAAIAQSLFTAAKTGNTTAQIFWLKTRAGWKETSALELSGTNGGAITVISKINVKD